MDRLPSRRAFLAWALGSPLFLPGGPAWAVDQALALRTRAHHPERRLLESPEEAVDVFDFELVAKQKLQPAHYTYLSMGIQDEFTLRANREAFGRFQLLPRRLTGVREPDTRTELLGTPLSSPIALAPCGAQKAFHPEAELAVARAAKRRDHLMLLSTGTSMRIQDVAAARGEAPWFQLYTSRLAPLTKLQLREAEDVGCPVVVLTVDQFGIGKNRHHIHQYRRLDNPTCQACHQWTSEKLLRAGKALGVDLADVAHPFMILDWGHVDRIRDATSMKLVIKGILTPDDAERCLEHGVDGIVVSNHGGRAEDTGLSSIEALPGIVAAVDGRVPVLVDSGFRRGSDAFKALALGASAVCVGRPYLWGLAAFGQPGVETVLALLRQELETIMIEMGTPDLAAIDGSTVRAAPGPG